MAEALHDIDRDFDADGDVLLVLHRPNSPFAVWSEHNDWEAPGPQWPEPKALYNSLLEFRPVDPAWLKRTSPAPWGWHEPEPGMIEDPQTSPVEGIPAEVAPVEHSPVEDVPAEVAPVEHSPVEAVTVEEKPANFEAVEFTSNQGSDITFRLSSKHLKSASPVFKIMLDGKWKESAITSESYYTLPTSEWDVEGLQIIMDIIHGRSHKVPRHVTLERLAKIAVIVDYYKCHDTVKFFSDTWMENLEIQKHTTEELCRELILRLSVSHVFNQIGTPQELLYLVVRKARGPLRTLDLPLRASIIDSIDRHRQEAVKSIINKYHGLIQYLTVRDCCSFECNSFLLGSLVTSMVEQGLYYPLPARPFHGYSVAELIQAVRKIKAPNWSEVGTKMRKKSTSHSCSLNDFFEPFLDQVENDLKKLTLCDAGLQSMADSVS